MAINRASLLAQLGTHLRAIAHDRNPYLATQNHFFVQQYLREGLEIAGEVRDHAFEVRGRTHHNWMVKIPGREPGRSPLLIGAHYDTVPGSPGADDNATGVAVLLELACFF
ncbi:peptidase M28, partial [filamentous cyanobacterium CCP5]